MIKRIRNWFRRKAECATLQLKYQELQLHYKQAIERVDRLWKANQKLRIDLHWLRKAANKGKIAFVTTILTHYETSVKHPLTHPARIDLMQKTLDALTKLIACNNLPEDKRADNIFFWRRMKKVLVGYGFW